MKSKQKDKARSEAEVGAGAGPDDADERREWTVTTSDGHRVQGFLPAWAENDPSATGVEPWKLPVVLEEINLYRELYEGEVLPSKRPSDTGPCTVFGVSLQCNPFSDLQTGLPVISIDVTEDLAISGLGVAEVGFVALTLQKIALRLQREAVPALVKARKEWAAQHAAASGPDSEPSGERPSESKSEPRSAPHGRET